MSFAISATVLFTSAVASFSLFSLTETGLPGRHSNVQFVKGVVRYFLIGTALIVGAISCLMLLISAPQIQKNKKVLADMRDRVIAIKAFQQEHGKLPSQEEFNELSAKLPVRYSLYRYELVDRTDVADREYPKEWAHSDGWVLSFWRGEWTEYYSSAEDSYTLTEQASWLGFCGPILVMPLIALLLFRISKWRVFLAPAGRVNV